MATTSRPARRRPDAAVFVVSKDLTAAIDRSPETLTALSFAAGLCQSHLSKLLHGAKFGPRLRPKVETLGAHLGVPADKCVQVRK